MPKGKKVLQGVNDGQNFNPADYTPYQSVNTPTNNYSTGDVNTYDYTRDNSLDRGNITGYDLPTLEDTRAQNQGIISSLGNDVGKFIGKTALNIVGGVAGTAYGVGSAIANGDVSKVWDNSFMNKVDEIDQGLDNIFKVYKSSDYQNQDFLHRMFLHPLQFTDDTTQALSFTAGAILTELLTEGLASETVIPKALKYMKFLSQGADAAEATQELTSATRGFLRGAADFGTTTKQLATGASFESIVEARKATMDLRNKMYADYAKDHPNEDMSDSVKADIDDRLAKAGVFTYLSNLALVGSTNLVEFPKIFGLGYKSSLVGADEIEKDAVTGLFHNGKKLFKDLNPIEKAGVILKNPFEEGVKEEGLQDVISNTNQQFFDRKNDDKSKGVVDRYLETVAHNLADTYTSKEGWNDIGMGMIIGGLGAPGRGMLSVLGQNNAIGQHGYDAVTNEKGEVTGYKRADIWTGGIVGAAKEHDAEVKAIQEVVDDLNKYTSLPKSMRANYDFLVQSQNLQDEKDKAIAARDIFNFNNAKDDQIHAYTAARIKANKYDDLLDTIDNMKKMSPDEFYTQFRGEEATAQTPLLEKTRFQQESINEFAEKAKNTKEAYDIVDSNYKGNNNDVREALAHSIASAKNLDVRERDINQSIAELSNGFISTLNLRGNNNASLEGHIELLNEQLKNKDLSKEDKDRITSQIENYTSALNNPEYTALQSFAEADPTQYTLNADKIAQLLVDSRKLRRKRQDYLNLYNTLFTEKGQNDFQAYQDKRAKDKATKLAEEQANQAKVEEEKAKVENNKNVVKKNEKITNTTEKTNPTTETTTQQTNQPNKDYSQVDETQGTPQEDLPNADFSDFENDNTPTETTIPDNISNENTLDVEERNVVEIEKNKEKPKEIEVRNINQEDSDTDLEILNDINLDLKRSTGNTITYLGVDKDLSYTRSGGDIVQRTLDQFDENGNLKINQYVDTKLFSNKYYNPGDEVTLIVPSFAQMQERGLQKYSEENYNKDINNQKEFPIAILNSENKIIGYLPTQSGINRLVQDDHLATALASNLALREIIFANKDSNYKTTITQKSPGMIMMNVKSNQQSLFKALGDGNLLANDVSIGIGQNGLIKLKKGVNFDKSIVNENIKNGVIYAIVPSSVEGQYVTTPMQVNKIGDTKARLLLEAIKLYTANAFNSLSANEKTSLDHITEYDFKNLKDVNDFIGSIIYASSDIKATDRNYFKLTKKGLTLSKTNPNMKYSLEDILNNTNDIQSDIIQILSDRYHTVSLDNLNNPNNFINYTIDDVYSRPIIQQVSYKNYQEYLDKNNIITSNIAKVHIEGNNYAFTAQPVIGIGDTITPEAPAAEVVKENTVGEVTRPVVKSERKTTKKLFDPTKFKPQSLEDINPEFIEQQNIKSGEDLQRKCL